MKLTFKERLLRVKQSVRIEEVLDRLGHPVPERYRNRQAPYTIKSIFNNERTPSMRIHPGKNIYYDNSSGKNGDLLNLVKQKLNLTDDLPGKGAKTAKSKALEWLEQSTTQRVQRMKKPEKTAPPPPQSNDQDTPNILVKTQPLKHPALIKYIREVRKIPLTTARKFLVEAHYKRKDKTTGDDKYYFGVGMKNDQGGIHVRNAHPRSKTVVGLPGITFLPGTKPDGKVDVFEGQLDFISKNVMRNSNQYRDTIISHSASNYQPTVDKILEKGYQAVAVYHDNDAAGIKMMEHMREELDERKQNQVKLFSRAHLYGQYSDVNDMLTQAPGSNMFSQGKSSPTPVRRDPARLSDQAALVAKKNAKHALKKHPSPVLPSTRTDELKSPTLVHSTPDRVTPDRDSKLRM
ncbi:MAG: toprim domain-containing protein [Cyclobacteriaceae bacterium]